MNEPDPTWVGGPGILSIGHSTHPIDVFMGLLRQNRIEVVADVRSLPYSRFNPQYNRERLRRELLAAGIQYDFLGSELGGRPDGEEFYDSDGHVLYGRMAESGSFRAGLERLTQRAEFSRVAMMCSEEDPADCHRYLLITGVLDLKGLRVGHIRCKGLEEDGQIGSTTEHSDQVRNFRIWEDGRYEQRDLFGQLVVSPWRSFKPVPRLDRSPQSSIAETSLDIYTIGFTRTSAEEFFTKLQDNRIERLVDVRVNNTSQLAGFAKREDLRYFLRVLVGVDYVHEPLLAPTKELLKAYRGGEKAWDVYESDFLDLMSERSVEKEIPQALFTERRVALLCSEPTAERCHRRLVVEYLDRKWRNIRAVDL